MRLKQVPKSLLKVSYVQTVYYQHGFTPVYLSLSFGCSYYLYLQLKMKLVCHLLSPDLWWVQSTLDRSRLLQTIEFKSSDTKDALLILKCHLI